MISLTQCSWLWYFAIWRNRSELAPEAEQQANSDAGSAPESADELSRKLSAAEKEAFSSRCRYNTRTHILCVQLFEVLSHFFVLVSVPFVIWFYFFLYLGTIAMLNKYVSVVNALFVVCGVLVCTDAVGLMAGNASGRLLKNYLEENLGLMLVYDTSWATQ